MFLGALFLLVNLGWTAESVEIINAVNTYWESLTPSAQEELARLYHNLFRVEAGSLKDKKAALEDNWRAARRSFLKGVIESSNLNESDFENATAEIVRKIESESSKRADEFAFAVQGLKDKTNRSIFRSEFESFLYKELPSLHNYTDKAEKNKDHNYRLWDKEGFQNKLKLIKERWNSLQLINPPPITRQEVAEWIDTALAKDASFFRGAALILSPENILFVDDDKRIEDVKTYIKSNVVEWDIVFNKEYPFHLELLENAASPFPNGKVRDQWLNCVEDGFSQATDVEVKKRYALLMGKYLTFHQKENDGRYLDSKANRKKWLSLRDKLQGFINENPTEKAFYDFISKTINVKNVWGQYRIYPPQLNPVKALSSPQKNLVNCAYFLRGNYMMILASGTLLFSVYALLPPTNQSKMRDLKSRPPEARRVLVQMDTSKNTVNVSFISDIYIKEIQFEIPSDLKERQTFFRELNQLLKDKYKNMSVFPFDSDF